MAPKEDIIRFIHFCRYLEIDISISTVQDRIRLQKIFYILKKYDLELDFRFNWYIHGPYSPDLAAVYYRVEDFLHSVKEDHTYFSYSEKGKLDIVKEFLKPIKGNAELLEYYASIIFIHNDMVFRKDERTFRVYENMIKQSKPGLYYKFKYKKHISNLKNNNLIHS